MDKTRRLTITGQDPNTVSPNDSKLNQSLTNIANNSVISGGVKAFSSFVSNPFGFTPPREKEMKKKVTLPTIEANSSPSTKTEDPLVTRRRSATVATSSPTSSSQNLLDIYQPKFSSIIESPKTILERINNGIQQLEKLQRRDREERKERRQQIKSTKLVRVFTEDQITTDTPPRKRSESATSKDSDLIPNVHTPKRVSELARQLVHSIVDEHFHALTLLRVIASGIAQDGTSEKNFKVLQYIDKEIKNAVENSLLLLENRQKEHKLAMIMEVKGIIKRLEKKVTIEETKIAEEEAKLKSYEEKIKHEEAQLYREQQELEREMASLGFSVSTDIPYNRSYSAKTMVIKNFEKYRAQLENLESTEETSPFSKFLDFKKFKEACRIFNESPKKALQYLVEEQMISKTSDLIDFLWRNEYLEKEKIGEFLGENEEVNLQTLEAYMHRFNFQGLDFDIALRQVLYCFRLPGEAQKIDRIIEKFASWYHHQNPNSVFHTLESAWALAFAIIMLNTDAHNPVIKKKMSKPEFVSNCRGINNGEDFPLYYLSEIYERITQDEIKMKQDGLYADAMKKGWIEVQTKKGTKVANKWKRYWAILMPKEALFFKKPGDDTPVLTVQLTNSTVDIAENKAKQKNMLELIEVEGGKYIHEATRYELCFETERELQSWHKVMMTRVYSGTSEISTSFEDLGSRLLVSSSDSNSPLVGAESPRNRATSV